MSQLLHLRVGRFFEAASLGRAQGLAATLEMTARLDELAHRSCRGIEWFSATQAWCDLGSGPPSRFALPPSPALRRTSRRTSREGLSPWAIAERLHHEIKTHLAIEVACGVASTRSASHAASALARPSGLVVALPGHEEALLEIARKDGVIINTELDDRPLKPSFVPRAIVRSAPVDFSAVDLPTEAVLDHAVGLLVDDVRRGMAELGVIAATIRLQFTNPAGTREAFLTLPDATSLGEVMAEAAHRLARRVTNGAPSPGRLSVSASHLISSPSQGSLFGWRGGLSLNRRDRPLSA